LIQGPYVPISNLVAVIPRPGHPIGGVVYLQIILSPEEASRIYDNSVFGKRLSRKNDNVVVFPFAFHIAVQQPLTTLYTLICKWFLSAYFFSKYAVSFQYYVASVMYGRRYR